MLDVWVEGGRGGEIQVASVLPPGLSRGIFRICGVSQSEPMR